MTDKFIILGIFGCYLITVTWLTLRGRSKTHTQEDFLVAGRKTHPFIMAMSYGAAFISTSAIVGFGGMSGCFGLGLLWLPFMNVMVGIIIAFIYFGKRTRKIGKNLEARTFPEFIGRRYDSKWLKIAVSSIIFFFMPLYCAVVLIGGARFLEQLLMINYHTAVFSFGIVIGIYVLLGGLKGVMYVDALMGIIMILGLAALLGLTYWELGGFIPAHQKLTDMVHLAPTDFVARGLNGWTSMPRFNSEMWWLLVSSLILGVGIGVLAQPQLAVRFMTVKSGKELNRAVLVGSIFIIITAGSAYMCGALSNVWFQEKFGMISVDVVKDQKLLSAAYQAKKEGRDFSEIKKEFAPDIDATPVTADEAKLRHGNPDLIIPAFINLALPRWMVYIFAMTLLSAAMTTLSALLHATGSALGHDFFGTIFGKQESTFLSKAGIVIGLIVSIVLAFALPAGIIARGTALFFGICAAAFMPSYIGALYWTRTTRAAVWCSVIGGFACSMFCMVFLHRAESAGIGICQWLFGRTELISTHPWPFIDPMVIALPISAFLLITVSLLTSKLPRRHIGKCFKDIKVREF
ncbi:MAG: sodium:solute symporter family protein [Victivallaceae bacterium]|nr:sodium:solute symporter family protein [Victivallaceae bacterium]